MLLNRKQVKALIEIVTGDKLRRGYDRAYINTYDDAVYLTVTSGSVLASLQLPDHAKEHDGKIIRKDHFVKWYKLAGNKDSLALVDVIENAQESEDKVFNWQALCKTDAIERTEFRMYPALMLTLNNLAGESLNFEFREHHISSYCLFARDDLENIYLMMPIGS